MADTNIEKKMERGLERRSQGAGGLMRRGEGGFPSLFRRNPEELFAMNPFTFMRRLTEDMDRMFSGLGGEGFGREMGAWAPPVEVREQNGNLVIAAELPGLAKEDVKIEVSEGSLVIQGERKREAEEERGGFHRSERSYGFFYREIPLPDDIKVDQVKAQFNNGILEVRVPIAEGQRKTRTIPIETGGERKQVGTQTGQTQTTKAG